MQIIGGKAVMGDEALFLCCILLLLGIGALMALVDALVLDADIGVKRSIAVILAISVIAMLMVIKYNIWSTKPP